MARIPTRKNGKAYTKAELDRRYYAKKKRQEKAARKQALKLRGVAKDVPRGTSTPITREQAGKTSD